MNKMNYELTYNIFISYRRDGGEVMALLLRDRLVSKNYNVFLDIESLNSGSFNTKLLKVIEGCTDFIIVLSENCLDRCVNEDDWVRAEIAHALRNNKNIIPLILRGFEWPSDLPPDIAALPLKNGVNASSNEYFDAAIDRVAEKFLISKPKSLFDKLGSFTKNVTEITANKLQINERMDISKLNNRVLESNKKISTLKKQISDFYLEKYSRGEEFDPFVMELCSKINAELSIIEESNREIQAVKSSVKTGEPARAYEAVICTNCGTSILDRAKFCPDCGTPVALPKTPEPQPQPEPVTCPSCGKPVPAGKKFCQECGAPIPAS